MPAPSPSPEDQEALRAFAGRVGAAVLTALSAQEGGPSQAVVYREGERVWVSHYPVTPAALFAVEEALLGANIPAGQVTNALRALTAHMDPRHLADPEQNLPRSST
jgi:hypothetical protein